MKVSKECACGDCIENCEYKDCDVNTIPKCCKCKDYTPKCFPAGARVSLENGKLIKMSELQTGDRLQTSGHWGNTIL